MKVLNGKVTHHFHQKGTFRHDAEVRFLPRGHPQVLDHCDGGSGLPGVEDHHPLKGRFHDCGLPR